MPLIDNDFKRIRQHLRYPYQAQEWIKDYLQDREGSDQFGSDWVSELQETLDALETVETELDTALSESASNVSTIRADGLYFKRFRDDEPANNNLFARRNKLISTVTLLTGIELNNTQPKIIRS